ncbi:MAG: hypothetical protein KDA83_10035 [Planctomycetales bacterium]|nr:hypothetical protein [Planctomycetales bacterium]
MQQGQPIIAVVTRDTRLAALKARWATANQALFRLEQAALHEAALRKSKRSSRSKNDDFDTATEADEEAADMLAEQEEYADEDEAYQRSLQALLKQIDLGYPIRTVDRSFLPNFDFGRCVAVLVIGPDGLVANTAKYVGDVPIIGINPDPVRNDGILLPFSVGEARSILQTTIARRAKTRDVTLAEANTNDGQRMLAFNDFYIGASTHISARYTLEAGSRMESQSSSGILISTGAGSTGWLSSLFNMAAGFSRSFGGSVAEPVKLDWSDRRLIWAVREPFVSRHSHASLVAGTLAESEELVIGSQMPMGGVIFSDGVEADFLEFSSGTIARISVSRQSARLVV